MHSVHAADNTAFYSTQELSNSENYWTEEKIRNAIPHPIPIVSNQRLKELLKQNPDSPRYKNNTGVQTMNGSNAQLAPPGEPVPADVYESPYSSSGALFFTKPDGKNYICTAQFTGKDNILLTAAHCVRDGSSGNYYTNFRFHRAFSNGGGQVVDLKCTITYDSWFNPASNFKYDYAFIQTKSASAKGWMGWKTQIPYYNWTAIGYPDNYGGNKYMYKVEGSKNQTSGGIVQMLDNPMGKGSSGGAWVAELSNENLAVGLNSFRLDVDPESLYGPLFDDQFVSLYNKAVNNCKD